MNADLHAVRDTSGDDALWKKIQKIDFTHWANRIIERRWGAHYRIASVVTDFDTGEKLMLLVNALFGTPLPGKYHQNASSRYHKLDNVTQALAMLAKAGVNVKQLSAAHIVDHNAPMILGMCWNIQLHAYAIAERDDVVESTEAVELLQWCRKLTDGYKGVHAVSNFTTDWQSGLAFCALIHKLAPDLMDYPALDPNDVRGNILKVLSIVESEFDVPNVWLRDVDDFLLYAERREVFCFLYELRRKTTLPMEGFFFKKTTHARN